MIMKVDIRMATLEPVAFALVSTPRAFNNACAAFIDVHIRTYLSPMIMVGIIIDDAKTVAPKGVDVST
jgi:hypothetical protein